MYPATNKRNKWKKVSSCNFFIFFSLPGSHNNCRAIREKKIKRNWMSALGLGHEMTDLWSPLCGQGQVTLRVSHSFTFFFNISVNPGFHRKYKKKVGTYIVWTVQNVIQWPFTLIFFLFFLWVPDHQKMPRSGVQPHSLGLQKIKKKKDYLASLLNYWYSTDNWLAK